ncbi:alanine--tRNA ligase [Candidatus Woesearchaeota archaeon]|nr:alanine--tRNA ligase [Candidatus Woesearchaeota archaeon]
MKSDKEVKKEFKLAASKEPDKFYATSVLKNHGFTRKKCSCGTNFWSVVESQQTCGDPACSGGFRFFQSNPTKKRLDYIQTWLEFSKLFRKLGYTPIQRYPVVARWRDDTDFVQASIYDFQPFVVSGEVKPPANPLVVPQFCLRFNDTDNVGITGSHYTGFVMIGQHAFMPPQEFDQAKYFSDIHTWLTKGLGLPLHEITYHEDAWAGGGNFGPSMEFFSRGLELGNQVYMQYENTPTGTKKLNINVLDMGMGHERNAWFTQGTSTSYETTFPTVCKLLYKKTGIVVDPEIVQRFLPYASYLNADEVEDLHKTWQFVAHKMNIDMYELKEKILPLAALYSVGEHSRSLLFALADGGLPSNVGGGYNLRVILRRALEFIDKYGWEISLSELAGKHAQYLRQLFPELEEHLPEVTKILEYEKIKYENTKQKSRQIVEKLFEQNVVVDTKKLLELYDTQGISPELVKQEGLHLGKEIKVPDDFYAHVALLHEKDEKKQHDAQTKKDIHLDLQGIPETKCLYFQEFLLTKSTGKVLKIIDTYVILDESVAYPTSGGQLHDIGIINGEEMVDVFKQGNVMIHVMKEKPHGFKAGDVVTISVDFNRRKQLAQHHTSTHIINYASRKVLGKHINQAGARKTPEKATIDITHYQALTDEEMKKIEQEANHIIKAGIPIVKKFYPRDEAEKLFGMEIYQGGVVPGKMLRIVDIKGIDVECCGGTHLDNTAQAEEIKLLKSTKISDGVVRITFTAGKAAQSQVQGEAAILETLTDLLHCEIAQIPGRASELFNLWKDVVKKKKQVESKTLNSAEVYSGNVLEKTCELLKTQPEHLVKTVERFKKEVGM